MSSESGQYAAIPGGGSLARLPSSRIKRALVGAASICPIRVAAGRCKAERERSKPTSSVDSLEDQLSFCTAGVASICSQFVVVSASEWPSVRGRCRRVEAGIDYLCVNNTLDFWSTPSKQ